MTHKTRRIYTISSEKPGGILLCLILSLTLCFVIAGCSKKSAETQVSSTEKAGMTFAEPSVFQSSETKGEQTQGSDATLLQGELEITLNYKHVDDIASNQYAVWVERSGLSSGNAQEIDTYSGATPKSGKQVYTWDCKDENGQTVPAGEYHFFVEGTIYWENAVIFEGVINLGNEENTAQAEASYTTDEAKKSDMITDVSAVYRP